MDTFFEKIYKKQKDIISRGIAGEVILVPIRGELADMQRIFSINNTGQFIWDQIDGRKKCLEIRDELVSEFTIEPEEADQDLQEFIDELLDAGLVEQVS